LQWRSQHTMTAGGDEGGGGGADSLRSRARRAEGESAADGKEDRAAARTGCHGSRGGDDDAGAGRGMLLLFSSPAVTLPNGCELLMAEMSGRPIHSISLHAA
jgi:hypothetical protein